MNKRFDDPVFKPAPRPDRPLGKVVQLTSVHARHDTRIFIKQCRTLSAHGYDVTLVVADGKGDERRDGVTIADVGILPGRIRRMFVTARQVFERAAALDADIYHLHDPELIPAGLKLKRLGKTVIFDSHEDTPQQLLGKPYLGPLSRRALSFTFSRFERYACAKFDAIVTATPFIRDKFLHINPVTIDVNNFPMIGELDGGLPWAAKQQQVSYVGGIGAIRGIRQLVQAAALLRSSMRLNLVGRFSEPDVEAEVRRDSGWERVNELGFLDRAGVRDVMARSLAGIVTFLPLPNHLDSHPTKMFEYMSSGIPVIASDFPLWRTIVEGNHCGVCVDPLDPGAIAAAIDYLADHPDIARSMGDKGRKAVLEKYNWDVEAKKLTDLYGELTYAKQAIASI
jgi:glycosyltransferase involved in cell wall biosynthesis